MKAENQNFQPTLTFLSETDKQTLLKAVYRLLAEIGQKVEHPRVIDLLTRAGCPADDNGVVRIPRTMVEKAIASVPSRLLMFNRSGREVMDLGGRRAYYGTGSDLVYALEPGSRQRHHCRLEDVEQAARVADALNSLDFVMSFAHPHELDPRQAYAASFEAMIRHTTKPVVNTATGRSDLAWIWEIGNALRGGENEQRAKPFTIHYAEPNSPLKHPFSSLDKLLFCAEKGMPLIYSPAPIAGSTAPMTIAGHVVQGLSESLFGLVVHQLQVPSAPFLLGMGPAVLDMATGQCSYNAPEYLMAYMAFVGMAKYLDIPNWGYAGTSDSQIADGQAAFESGLMTFMASTAGSNLNHDVGYLDFGRTGSLEMMVMLDEIIDQVKRMQRGIPVDDEEIALDVIAAVGHQDHFLGHPHTQRHFRATQWRPRLFCRQGRSGWEADGGKTLLERSLARLNRILETHQPEPLPETVSAAVSEVMGRFRSGT